ncbi:hypothetical protein SIPHO075v1_p0044 [Vibrio phage PS65A.1]|nr:hypothetical protein SIPHO075v1_p0044 [Vibrio phage PS65A.1]
MSTEMLRLEIDIPEATEKQAQSGWSIEYTYLETLTRKVNEERDGSLCQEQVEAVLSVLLEMSEA